MRGRKCSSTLPDGMEGDFIETERNLFCFLNVFLERFFLIGNIECLSSYLSESGERSAHNFMISN